MKLKNALILFLTAVIWGMAFVAQSVGMDYVGPFTFNSVRFLIGGFTLLIYLALTGKKAASEPAAQENGEDRRTLLLGGICCGLALCTASSLQQIGITGTTVGKAGFITAFYIILVPILGLFFGKRCSAAVWVSVVLALIGFYFLCMQGSLSIGKGDAAVLLCAFFFAVHILVVDHFSPRTDGVKLSCIQFFVSGIVCAVPMLLFEKPQISSLLAAWQPILYAGVLSCGVAYTLQIVGQKGMNPTVASLIMSLESVVSAIAGAAILGQTLSAREVLGCALIFAGILLAQLPQRQKV